MYYRRHSGLVLHWVQSVCLFMDNATSINNNRYLIGWAYEAVQNKIFDIIRLPFLVSGHEKFSPDRLFTSIANFHNASDVFTCLELVEIATRCATAYEEMGLSFLVAKKS